MINKRDIYYSMGPATRRLFRRLYYFPVDIIEKISGKRHPMAPPKGRVFIGSGDFIKQGQGILKQFKDYGGLKPNHRVLDIGCGIGRLAVPLVDFLDDKQGSYEGFDIVKSGIDWCKKNIQSKHPIFNFIHIDLRNDLYNLKTDKNANNFVFPYEDDEFDFAFLTSVFTHMMPEDVSAYLEQISRVLKKGGVCFATFFVINEESDELMKINDVIKFDHKFENYYLHNAKVKEANVAFDESYLDELINKHGLKISKKHFGYWPGRPKDKCVDFQDIYILEK